MITGFTAGTFDLLHPGHIAMFIECKKQCDHLIVGLQTDPTIDRPNKNKPVQSVFERWQQLKAIKYIDSVVPYDTEQDLINILSILDINIRFIGGDHVNDFITGKSICDERNIDIVFNTRYHSYSSTELRNRMEK